MVPLGTTSTLFLFSQHTTAVDIHPETAPFSASFLCAGNKADKLREKRGCRKAPSCDMGKNHRSHHTRRPHHRITSMPVPGRRARSKHATASTSNTCVETSTRHQHLRTNLPPAQPPSRRSSPQSSTFRPPELPARHSTQASHSQLPALTVVHTPYQRNTCALLQASNTTHMTQQGTGWCRATPPDLPICENITRTRC